MSRNTTTSTNPPSFRSFLTEMAFSPSTFDKVCSTMTSILSKRIGQLYRYGGPTGIQQFNKAQNGTGIGVLLFHSGTNKALRLNLESKLVSNLDSSLTTVGITSVDFWSSYSFDAETWSESVPTVNLEIPAGTNLVQLAQMITDVFNNMSLNTKTSADIQEAVRVSGQEFASLVQKELGTINVTMDQMKAVAAKHGVNVPMSARQEKATRGMFSLGHLLTTGQKEILKVPASLAVAEKLAKTEKIDVDELFSDLSDLTRLVIKNKRPSLVITGDPGTGKTYTVQKEIEAAGLAKNKDWVLVKGKVSPYGIYSTLYMNRNHTLIVFDDSDDVFFTPEAKNILKAALDSYGERTVSWISKATINISGRSKADQEQIMAEVDAQLKTNSTEAIKLPSEFDFQGRIIFISNLAPEKIEPAILSRSLTINIQLSPEDVFKKMEKLIGQIEPEVPMKIKKEVLEFLIAENAKHSSHAKMPNMRQLVAGIQIASSGMKNWQRLMKYS